MTSASDGAADIFARLTLDYVEFYVTDVEAALVPLSEGFGLAPYAATSADGASGGTRSVAVGAGDIRLILTEARVQDNAVLSWTDAHGDSVAGLGLQVADARAAFETAVRRGARPVMQPTGDGGLVTASVAGFGDVLHTFVERPENADPRALPGLTLLADTLTTESVGLHAVDHVAVCLEAGQLDSTVEFYESVLDFRVMFEEHIVVGAQAMNSKVVCSVGKGVVLTLLEPDVKAEPGQIDQFIKQHGGAGVQHLALTTSDVVGTVAEMSRRGVGFLRTPGAYYDRLVERLEESRHPVEELRRLDVLVDEDHDGQLFQIFCQSTHPRKTFFFEVIERAGAHTFGTSNIKALYAAVEAERLRQGDAV